MSQSIINRLKRLGLTLHNEGDQQVCYLGEMPVAQFSLETDFAYKVYTFELAAMNKAGEIEWEKAKEIVYISTDIALTPIEERQEWSEKYGSNV